MRMRVTDITSSKILARRVWVALTPWDRARGLAMRPKLAEGDALVVQPCHIAHTLGLGYPIVAVYLDGVGRVLAAPLIPPARLGPYMRHTYLVIELPASRMGMVAAGDLIEIGVAKPDPPGTSAGRRKRPLRFRWGFLKVVSYPPRSNARSRQCQSGRPARSGPPFTADLLWCAMSFRAHGAVIRMLEQRAARLSRFPRQRLARSACQTLIYQRVGQLRATHRRQYPQS